jgi:hypothetical protein
MRSAVFRRPPALSAGHPRAGAARTWSVALVALALALAAGGCSSRPEREARRAAALPPQTPLAADGKWFAGSMLAHVTVDPAQPPGTPVVAGSAGGAVRAGGRGRGHRGGAHAGDEEAPRPVPVLATPRQMLQITLTNLGGEPVTVAVTDLQSALGNFAVRPEQLTLGPAASGSVNPMFASFPDNLDALDVTLALKIDGRTESRTLRLTAAPGR